MVNEERGRKSLLSYGGKGGKEICLELLEFQTAAHLVVRKKH
jgi:hypothetical protein